MKCERCVFRAEQESAVPRGHIWFSRAARLSHSLSRSLTMCPPYLGFAFLTLLNYSTLLLGLVIALVINLNGYELQVHVGATYQPQSGRWRKYRMPGPSHCCLLHAPVWSTNVEVSIYYSLHMPVPQMI